MELFLAVGFELISDEPDLYLVYDTSSIGTEQGVSNEHKMK